MGYGRRIRPANLRSLIFSTPGTAGRCSFNFRRVTIVSSKYSGGCIYDTGKPERNPVQTRFKHPETSTLVRRFSHGAQLPVQSALDGKTIPHWYRMINRLMWIWRGIDPREILEVQARIVMSDAERTDDDLYDTVIGYRGGNWIYEWATQAMVWQQKPVRKKIRNSAVDTGCMRLRCTTLLPILI